MVGDRLYYAAKYRRWNNYWTLKTDIDFSEPDKEERLPITKNSNVQNRDPLNQLIFYGPKEDKPSSYDGPDYDPELVCSAPNMYVAGNYVYTSVVLDSQVYITRETTDLDGWHYKKELTPSTSGRKWRIYPQVDGDKDYDIAMGRIVGEDASIFTMSASRSVTYNNLIDDSIKDRACVFGNFETPKEENAELLRNNNYHVDLIQPGDGFDTLEYSIYTHWNHGSPFLLAPFVQKESEEDRPTSPAFITTGGCRQGNTVIVKDYQDRESTYSDYAAVKLARVGAIGYHAFSKFADKNFTFGRLVFLQGIFDGATLGEAHLRSINATQTEYGDRPKQIEPMMFYGDPALKIHIPNQN